MFTFSKKLRLLTTSNFEYVFQGAQKISSSEIIILGRFNELIYPRIGFVITKKNIKYAYERNRIKRLIREYFRLHQDKLAFMDFVILVRKGIINLNNKQIIKILDKLWRSYYHVPYKY